MAPAEYLSKALNEVNLFVQNHQHPFVGLLTFLAILVVEVIWMHNAFVCPCTHQHALFYGLVYVFGPAFMLLLVSIFVHVKLWKHVEKKRECCPCPIFWSAIGRGSLPFFMWIVLIFLDGRIYSCFFVESIHPCQPGLENNSTELIDPDKTDLVTTIKSSYKSIFWPSGNASGEAISQAIGVIIAAVYSLIALFVFLCIRSKRKTKDIHSKFVQKYQEKESEMLLLKLPGETAEKLAETNINILIHRIEELSGRDWDEIKVLKLESNESKTDPEVYSSLHEWARQKLQVEERKRKAEEEKAKKAAAEAAKKAAEEAAKKAAEETAVEEPLDSFLGTTFKPSVSAGAAFKPSVPPRIASPPKKPGKNDGNKGSDQFELDE